MGFKTLTVSEIQEIKQYTDDDSTNWSNMPEEFSDKVRRGIAAGLVNESAFAWFDNRCWYKGSTMKVFTDVGDRMFDEQGQARQAPQQPSPTIVNYHMNGLGARVNNNSTDNSINDYSTQGKMLVNCNNAELLAEKAHRTSVLKKERRSKLNKVAILWFVIMGIVGGFSLYFFLNNERDLAGYVLSIGSLGGTLVSLKLYNDPTEFETRQVQALKEIEMIRRERGDE